MDLDQGLYLDRDVASVQEDAGFASGASFLSDDPVIDVDVEESDGDDVGMGKADASRPRLMDRFNRDTTFQGLSLSQLAVHSLWIVDYLRQLGETEMADGDIESIGHCADDLEGAIMMMFQLAGGTRQELRQRYQDIKQALQARQPMTVDRGHA